MDYTEENIKMEDIRQSTDCGDGCAKNSVVGLPYLNRPFWKSKNCKLLNGNYTFFRKAQIQVYMPEEPFKEDELGNTNVGVICNSNLGWWGPFANDNILLASQANEIGKGPIIFRTCKLVLWKCCHKQWEFIYW
jgi:hypothetical protein